MAKELGLAPKSLMKNIPGPNQKWKAPVKVWIRDLYEEKFEKVLTPKKQEKPVVSEDWYDEEDLPF